MSLTRSQMDAIFNLHPNVVVIRNETAFDKDENEVSYDINEVNTKSAELQAQAESAKQDEAAAKVSAQTKLAALGFTQAEITAIIGA
jgi:hypothetical protein